MGIIDIHCHVLPGVDDGSRDMEESLKLLKLGYDQGIRSLIATPHYSRRRENSGIPELCSELEKAFHERYPDLDGIDEYHIYPGQEGFYHEEYAARIRTGQAVRMNESNYVLVEFDTASDADYIFRGLRQILQTGVRPILAHIERYPDLRKDGDEMWDTLAQAGVVLQMNYDSISGGTGFASSFRNRFDKELKFCRRMVTEGRIALFGTDCHRTDFRPPDITGALEWLKTAVSPNEYDRLTRANALRLIQGEAIITSTGE